MFITYLLRELRRRMRQAIFIAAGLALGVGLVIAVTAASLVDYRVRGPDSRAVVPRSRWGMASLPSRHDGQF
jgi:hypothetical protein